MKRSIKRIKSVVFIVRQTCTGRRVFSLCYYFEMPFFIFNLLSSMPGIKLVPRILYPVGSLVKSTFPTSTTDEGFKVWINLLAESSLLHIEVKTHVIPSTDWYLPPFSQPNEKHMVLKCACDPSFGRSR